MGSDLKTLALADDSNVRRNHSAPNHGRSCHVILYCTLPRLSASTSTSPHLPLTSPCSLSSFSECHQHKCLQLRGTIAICGLSDTDNEQVPILWLIPIKTPYPPLIPSLLCSILSSLPNPSISMFLRADSLTRLTLAIVAHTLNPEQIQQVRLSFIPPTIHFIHVSYTNVT